jgi:HK97 family phage portal protein
MGASRADVARVAGRRRVRSSGISLVAGARRGLRSAEALAVLLGDVLPAYQPPATEDEAMGLPPFGRAVALVANAIASTGWYAQRRDPATGLAVRLPDQPSVLTDPFPLSTPWHYRWAVAEDGILYGNTFALPGDPDWRTGRPGWLVPIPADDVWILSDPARPGWFQWAIGGTTFDADEIFHIPFGARSGEILGRGVIQQYGQWLGGAVAAEQYSRDTFAAGALPPAVIIAPSVTTQAQADELKAKWRLLTSTREPVIFPNGTELKPVVGNAEQSQLVQARTWNAQMCANVVGVPGWKLGLEGPTMTYQNVETGDIDFVRDSVDRWAGPLAASVTKWLMPTGTEVVFDYTSRMRSDTKTTAEVLTTLTTAGILTKDEARATLNRPPLPVVDNDPPDDDQIDPPDDVRDLRGISGRLPAIASSIPGIGARQ